DRTVIGALPGGCLELDGGCLGDLAPRPAERFARERELTAELVHGAGHVARAAREAPTKIAQHPRLARELLARAAAGREHDPRLAFVTLDPDHPDKPDLRGAGAVGAAAGRDVE